MSYIGNEPIVSSTRTITETTATAGQTTFTANGGYTVGFVDVFVNGAQLQTTDFTATNGSTVVLASGCTAGDDVRLVAWGTFSTSNLVAPNYTGTLTGGTDVVNIGSGQIYKDASGNVGVGTTSPSGASGKVLEINGAAGQARLALKNNVSGSSATDGLQIVLDGSGDAYIEQRDNANLGFLTNAINRLNIDASGRVTAPYQPYFLAYRSTDQTGYNAADVGGDHAVLYNTTAVNTGNHFNTANGKFTAPVSGIYLFQASAYSAATVFSQNWLIVNGTRGNATDWVHATNNMTCGFDIVNLAAGDTVGYKAYAVSQTNVTVQTNANHTYFKGYFLG